MDYPRTVIIPGAKIRDLLKEKGRLILDGRNMTDQIEKAEKEMEDIDKEIQEAEGKVDIKDIAAEAEEVTKEFNDVVARMDAIKQRTYDRIKSEMDPEIYKRYESTKSKKENLETARNKVALKAQKINDRVIPLVRRAMVPHLQNKYEDFESVKIDDESGQVVGTIFSHLDDFEKRFEKKAQKK